MTLAIFDLDHTLLDGDTDHLWSNFLCDRGVLERSAFERRYEEQNNAYDGGTLDPADYTYSLIETIAHLPTRTLKQLLAEFTNEVVPDRIAPAARELLQNHRDQGHFLLIITATVEFLAHCSIQALAVDDFIATQVEWRDDRPTAQLIGAASFREGKVTRLNQWLAERDYNLRNSWFYSDSINDLPMLELVDNPVTVNADANLRAIAEARDWPQLTIRLHSEQAHG